MASRVFDMGRELARVDMTWSTRPASLVFSREEWERACREMFTLPGQLLERQPEIEIIPPRLDMLPLPLLWPSPPPREQEPPKPSEPPRPERKIVV